jgi:hypothetical protein
MDLTLFAKGMGVAREPLPEFAEGRRTEIERLADSLRRRGVSVSLARSPTASTRLPRGHVLVLGGAGGEKLLSFVGRAKSQALVWPDASVLRRVRDERGLTAVRIAIEGKSPKGRAGAPSSLAKHRRELAARHGIVSLFAFGGIFSHGVRSLFDRKQHGPDWTSAAPIFASTYELLYAHHALLAARARGVVSRVDLCRDEDGVVSLLAIDPSPDRFGASFCEESVTRFAETIVRWIQRT